MQITSTFASDATHSMERVMNDLMPPSRLNASQLKALAGSLRRQAGSDDTTTDSVAAALESVSRRRAARERIDLLGAVATRVQSASYRLAWAWRMRGEFGVGSANASRSRPVQRKAAASNVGVRAMSLEASAVRQALMAVENGNGLSPDLCEVMVVRGWVEWVDHVHGTPIDMNHPRSLLRLTDEGREQFETVFAAEVVA
ncbi:MAG: hypothetical protein EOP80_07755 [Variovorax sp.]|nr:MAG: hypothetical protein EOP80_07755 [Variovorax sp.]